MLRVYFHLNNLAPLSNEVLVVGSSVTVLLLTGDADDGIGRSKKYMNYIVVP